MNAAICSIAAEHQIPESQIKKIYYEDIHKGNFWRIPAKKTSQGFTYISKFISFWIPVIGLATAIISVVEFMEKLESQNQLIEEQNQLERKKIVQESWRNIDEHEGEIAGFGRKESIENLASQEVSLNGLNVRSANLNLLNLGLENLQKINSNIFTSFERRGFWPFEFRSQNGQSLSEQTDSASESCFQNAKYQEESTCIRLERSIFRGAQLQASTFENASMIGANFSAVLPEDLKDFEKEFVLKIGTENHPYKQGMRTDLTNAALINSDLRSTNFTGAILTHVNFSNSKLDQSILQHADLACADFRDIELVNTEYSDFAAQLMQANNWRVAFYNQALYSELKQTSEDIAYRTKHCGE
ncbi:MAG: pentapeptide repeat-containing protein [Cyanobacteria bacterium J06627_32]